MDLEKRPLVSIVAVSYNHEKYIEDAIKSLLNQDYSPLEIVISDDNSSDHSFSIAEALVKTYQGPHKVILNKNAKNLGIGGNVSKAIELAHGELLVSADCDDISESNRVSTLIEAWQSQNPKPHLITSDAWDTTQDGRDIRLKRCGNLEEVSSIQKWIKNKPHFFGCTNMYTRELIQNFGSITNECGATDQIMVLRAILLGGAQSLHKPLVHHRQGGVTGNRPMNVIDKIRRLSHESTRTIADIEQHIKDAKKLGLAKLLENYFQDQLAEAKFTPQILNAESFREKIRIFFKEKKTPLLKKIRLLSYACLPLMHRIIFKIKREIQQ